MKKVYFAIVALAAMTFASCEKAPIGGTATEKMAGQWYVKTQGVDDKGEVLFDDPDLFGLGNFLVLTYNTSENSADSMWIGDVDDAFGYIWDYHGFQVKAGCDQAASTFSLKSGVDIIDGDTIEITNGKILFGAAKTPSGAKADSIVFDILFSGDPYAGVYYDRIRFTGYRYTGLVADE